MGRKKRDPQSRFDWRERGGERKGAGRKPEGKEAGISHKARHRVDARYPVLVTMKRCEELPDLRSEAEAGAVLQCLAEACEREAAKEGGCRLVHFALLGNHLHLLIEAEGIAAQSNFVGGLAIRIAKRLNKLWGRSGRVWRDRYHSKALLNPTALRYAMLYVFRNARKHRLVTRGVVDWLNSAPLFLVQQGAWHRQKLASRWSSLVERATCAPRSWLLRIGWSKAGPVGPYHIFQQPIPT